MKYTLITLISFNLCFGAYAQTDSTLNSTTSTASGKAESPYVTKFAVDAPVIAAGLGLTAVGFRAIQNKEALTEAEAIEKAMSKNDVNGFDRFSAGWYSPSADDASYIPFYASFAYPVVGLLNRNTSRKAGQVMVLYLETMATTGALFTLAAGYVNRPRPLVYGTEAPIGKRQSKNSQRSFYAGHTAATAAASFFAAKVFSDFNPDSKLRPYVWGAAALTAGSVGYLRLKAGQHFLSDNILGFGIGMATGVLVPHFHKKKNAVNGLSLQPYALPGYSGMAMTYRFQK